MFLFARPTDRQLAEIRDSHRSLDFSYSEQGATRDTPPPHYVVDHHRVQLGFGKDVFARAQEAFRSWEMVQLDWLAPCWPDASLESGEIVGTVAQVLGLWCVNVCRIVYCVDDASDTGPVRRFGFAYGTLPGHVERGEERYQLEWHADDDSVWYDLLAFSRPGRAISWIGYPYVRRMQRRFARESMEAMRRAVKLNA
jgi:uncharacterized protein (UPF0548 family)